MYHARRVGSHPGSYIDCVDVRNVDRGISDLDVISSGWKAEVSRLGVGKVGETYNHCAQSQGFTDSFYPQAIY